jgi:hypothetical protein
MITNNSCGYKYEIGLRIYEPEIAWILGPVRCGKGDGSVFQEDGLKDKLASTPGKMGIADGGYEMGEEKDMGFLCLPNTHQGGGKLLHIKTGLVLRPFESFYNYFIRFAVILI